MRIRTFIALIATMLALPVGSPRAQTVADFYRGRQFEIIVGNAPGTGYDVYARLLAKHLPRFLPGGPNIVVRNMPGAGGLRVTNHLYQTAPKDGSTIGTFARDIVMLGLLGGNSNAQFDIRKFNWLGSMSSFNTDAYIMWVRKEKGITNIEQARMPGGPTILMGSVNAATSSGQVPTMFKDLLGINVKLVTGYADSGAVGLAVDRGEVDGQMATFTVIGFEKPHWLEKDSPMRPLVQYLRATRDPRIPDVPTARELARNDRERLFIELSEAPWAISRPFVAPPDIPADRAEALQKAFWAVQIDPGYLADAERAKLDVSPMDGRAVMDLIAKLAAAPPEFLDYMRKLQGGGGD